MPVCPRCGKKTSWRTEPQLSEFKGSRVCSDCFRVLVKAQNDAPYMPPKVESVSQTKYVPPTLCSACHFSKVTTRLVDKQSTINSLANFANALNSVNPYGYSNITLEKESVRDWRCSKFDFPLTDMNKAKKCTSFITQYDYEAKCLNGEMDKEKANIQIILDFSSLKDIMAKGGLVMSTYKCPNCNGMVKLPEEGKVLICEYCGTPIKPVDIFEKIKSLIT